MHQTADTAPRMIVPRLTRLLIAGVILAIAAVVGVASSMQRSLTTGILLGAVAGGIGYLLLSRSLRAGARHQEAKEAYRRTQAEFTELMQVTNDEREAHALLRRHLEQSIPDARAAVLSRNNSADRLEPATSLDAGSSLATRLEGATPRACLAVRLARQHTRLADEQPLLACEICGAEPSATTCSPLLVSGEVIGSVLVTHPDALSDSQTQRVVDSISQAAPVLGNLRNLAIAESRAATDSLTGLPNRRAIDEVLKLMIAQAGRTLMPLSAVLLDLDHFKRINDTYGHDQGDQVLATVAQKIAGHVRASDFAGRNGGEEFLVLLPNTGRDGALIMAEKLREALEQAQIPGLGRAVTGSFGVATFPDDAGDADTLLRLADRALYSAKGLGRNRVEGTSPASSSTAALEDASEAESMTAHTTGEPEGPPVHPVMDRR
jgi:diguanylate cyclase (GGDEF)-like protein